MQTIKPVDPAYATGKTKELLDIVQQRSRRIPNMVALMANSPAALGAYLNFAGAFRDATLSAEVRGLIAVVVAEVSGCDSGVAVGGEGRGEARAPSGITRRSAPCLGFEGVDPRLPCSTQA